MEFDHDRAPALVDSAGVNHLLLKGHARQAAPARVRDPPPFRQAGSRLGRFARVNADHTDADHADWPERSGDGPRSC